MYKHTVGYIHIIVEQQLHLPLLHYIHTPYSSDYNPHRPFLVDITHGDRAAGHSCFGTKRLISENLPSRYFASEV